MNKQTVKKAAMRILGLGAVLAAGVSWPVLGCRDEGLQMRARSSCDCPEFAVPRVFRVGTFGGWACACNDATGSREGP